MWHLKHARRTGRHTVEPLGDPLFFAEARRATECIPGSPLTLKDITHCSYTTTNIQTSSTFMFLQSKGEFQP